jgi:predicted Fe-Mo cluster-binding NifX family protein
MVEKLKETIEEEPRPLRPKRKAYRPDKVAVATDSGEYIDACFGKTESFLIYGLKQRDGDNAYSYELIEKRAGPKPCKDRTHDLNVLEETAELLKDCGMVLAGRIGPAAVKALSDRGVMGLSAPLRLEEALKRLAKN